MTQEINTPKTPEAPSKTVTDEDLFFLMSQLESLLTDGPARAQGTLLRQSEVLDALFSTLVARHLKEAVTGHFYGTTKPADTTAWLGMILQVQKQCSEAIRVASAVNYMDTMASAQLTPSSLMARRPPHPRSDS